MSASAHSIDRDTFLRHVRQSGLVSADELDATVRRLPPLERGRAVARVLVEKGILTRFQAERLLVGRTEGFLIGQYRILDLIGRGGMGRVFKAEHMTMKRIVALKVLPSQVMRTSRARQLFDREVRAAAQLSHPHIVTAFDANQSGDRAYLVMEYVDGPNLHEFVKEKGPMPVAQACEVIRQVALGLGYAHDLGMVHRDIKPANLLIHSTLGRAHPAPFVVKILDFGLARLAVAEEDHEHHDSIVANAQAVIGTPDYLSPEQARNVHEADRRSDIYSLGCTLYYLLSGQVPFPGGTSLEKLVRHGSEEPIPIEGLRPQVPPALGAIVRKLMAKDPNRRFQNCHELIDAITPLCYDAEDSWVPIEAMPPADPTLPVSGVMSAETIGYSPWASLTEDHMAGATLATGGPTMAGPQAHETHGPRPAGSGWWWNLLSIVFAVGVAAGVIAAIVLLIQLAS